MATANRKRAGGPFTRWAIGQTDPTALGRLEREAGLSPLLARVLAGRAVTEPRQARRFLEARLSDHLRDPFELKDMDRAADRIAQAIGGGEPITIFGDYDVDGITATVLLIRLLRHLNVEPSYYIPHRLDEGYGLSCKAIEALARQGTRLIVTVDTGISSVDEVAHAASLGIECVITDHHQVGPALPAAVAVVDPNRPDCTSSHANLSGVGVAFKLAHAVLRRLGVEERKAKGFLKSVLEIVALGTVADIAPLVGENRALVRAGLERLERTQNPGLAALLSLDTRAIRPLQTEAITYFLAPRLNAAGRTEHASLAVDLLTATDPDRAMDLAHRLDELNDRRRVIERIMFDEALRLIDRQCRREADWIYVVAGQQWHLGVVGIVASKLSNHFGRPVIVLSESEGLLRGSARSGRPFDIHTALTRCADLLETFGGHREAAGLSLKAERVGLLRERLAALALEAPLEEEGGELTVDAVCEADELSLEAVEDLAQLEPCGQGNPRPVFAVLAAGVVREPKIVGANHLKTAVCCGPHEFDVIGFGMGGDLARLREIDGPIDVAFRPAISDWGGAPRVELHLSDFRSSSI